MAERKAAAERGPGELHKHIPARNLIADSMLGLSDGLITNLAFLAGLSGAASGIPFIRLAGTAAMLAGAISMFFGGLLAARSDHGLYRADAEREAYEIVHEPDEERRELLGFYRDKGLTADEAEVVVRRVTSNREKWLEDMLIHELHLHHSELENPFRAGCVLGLSFLVGALVPLLSYFAFAAPAPALPASMAASLAFLFAAGAGRGRLARRSAWKSGAETLLLGAAGFAILYVIGTVLSVVV